MRIAAVVWSQGWSVGHLGCSLERPSSCDRRISFLSLANTQNQAVFQRETQQFAALMIRPDVLTSLLVAARATWSAGYAGYHGASTTAQPNYYINVYACTSCTTFPTMHLSRVSLMLPVASEGTGCKRSPLSEDEMSDLLSLSRAVRSPRSCTSAGGTCPGTDRRLWTSCCPWWRQKSRWPQTSTAWWDESTRTCSWSPTSPTRRAETAAHTGE